MLPDDTTATLTEHDIYLFREGTHTRLYDKLGCHPGNGSTRFAVWAPNARAVSVIGDFNDWNPESHALGPRWDSSGIWEGDVPGVPAGAAYKFRIAPAGGAEPFDKADPFAVATEAPPRTASRAWSLDYTWNDAGWMQSRGGRNSLAAPLSIYEVHLGSWRRREGRWPTYRDIADELGRYAVDMGFTHVELMPVCEHPFYGSWGYQTTGYFAPTARYGTPQDLMYFVDALHQQGIGVILDWVPSHFPDDPHGLSRFDGTSLFEHADPRQGYHPEWHSSIFNYGRHEVRAFLLSSAHFWLDKYHFDGLRVDAVASMLYLDYGRKAGEWVPNRFGGKENLDAIEFIRTLNASVYRDFPDVQTIAEESTAWPMVSRPTDLGGLGFGLKWNMGWMHDTLRYFQEDPLYRRHHDNKLTFSLLYAFHENFILPLSHDEVVYGKGSLIGRQPGDAWRQFAGLRTLYGYMWTHPGKKLLFMCGEFGQRREWTHEGELEWWVIERFPEHQGVQRWVADLNRLYRSEPALHEIDTEEAGFEWVDPADLAPTTLSYLRHSRGGETMLVLCNFAPVPHRNFVVGVPAHGTWLEVANSDARDYGGSGMGNLGSVATQPVPSHGRLQSLTVTLPPLSTLMLKHRSEP
ncbi:MAG: 1,4-alpha-glucan branching protein GlgB [Gammaproteobacteria bacterium]